MENTKLKIFTGNSRKTSIEKVGCDNEAVDTAMKLNKNSYSFYVILDLSAKMHKIVLIY
jgi:hypothetical protein